MCKWIKAYRLVTFVPADKAEGFAKAISPHIPQFLGPYDRVLWQSEAGTEQYRPLEGSEAERGKVGQIVRSSSVRFEISLPQDKKLTDEIIERAIIPNHPWDEPVILLYEHEILDVKPGS